MDFPSRINWTSLSVHFRFKNCGVVFLVLFKIKKNIISANSREPDQTPRSVASEHGLHCLHMSHKKDAIFM